MGQRHWRLGRYLTVTWQQNATYRRLAIQSDAYAGGLMYVVRLTWRRRGTGRQ